MASNIINVTPTAGTGNSTVSVSPLDTNSYGDKVSTISVSNGVVTRNLVVTQYGRPTISRIPPYNNVPAAGGTLTYTVQTHYDIVFRSVPTWVHIADGLGNQYSEGQRISAPLPSGTFNFTIDANTDTTSTRNSGSFNMAHYLNNTLVTIPSEEIRFTQDAATVADFINLDVSTLVFDWDDSPSVTRSANVTSNVSWTASLNINSYFTIVSGASGTNNGTIVISANDNNHTSTYDNTTILTITDGTITKTVTLYQYPQPLITETSPSGETINPLGDTRGVHITSHYRWFWGSNIYSAFEPRNGWISMKEGQLDFTAPSQSSMANPTATAGNDFTLVWIANDGLQPRTTSLYVSYQRADGTIGVSYSYVPYQQQSASSMAPTITTSSSSTINPTGGAVQVVVNSDYDWYWDSIPSYISITETSTGNSANYDVLDPCIAPTTNKSYTITFDSNPFSVNAQTRTYTPTLVYQGGSVALSTTFSQDVMQPVNPPHYYIAKDDISTQSVTVTMDAPWVATSNAVWLDVNSYTGTAGTSTMLFSANRSNTDAANKVTTISLTKNGSPAGELSVTQYGTDYTGTASYIENSTNHSALDSVPANSSTYTYKITVTSDSAWSATSSASHLRILSNSKGQVGTTEIPFSISNNTGVSRIAFIWIDINGNRVLTIPVIQDAG